MTKRSIKFNNFMLTPRDLDILVYLAKYGVSTRKNLHSLFWKTKVSSNTHHRRIRQLIDAGFIVHICKYTQGLGLKLTIKGHRFLKKHDHAGYSFEYLQKNYGSDFKHDETLVRILDAFEENKCVKEIIHEKDIARFFSSNKNSIITIESLRTFPDALVLMDVKNIDRYFTIELELSRKSKKRYKKIIKSHLLEQKWDFILYIVEDKSIEKVIKETLKELKERDFDVHKKELHNVFYFADLDTFLKEKSDTIFKSDNHQFSLNEINSWIK